ncbi:MAG: YIP1 family protein [Bacillota bacterium]|nr:YIP1 family protein [Bacillota bacterium]
MDNNLEESNEIKLSLIDRITGVFINPEAVFKDINKKADILKPSLIIMAIFIITYIMQLAIIKEAIVEQFKVVQLTNPSFKITDGLVNKALYSGLFAGSFMIVIVPIIKGMLVYGIALINNGKGKLKETVSVFIYSYFIIMLGQVILAVLKVITGNLYITLSPAVFFKTLEVNSFMNVFLSYFDVFTIIYLAVTVIGVKIIHKLSIRKATIAVLVPSIIYLLLTIVPTFMNLG